MTHPVTHAEIAAIREWLCSDDYRLVQVPEIHALLRHIDALTDERDAIAKFIGYGPSPGSHYDLPAAVKDFVAGETDAAATAERERCVAYLRSLAEAGATFRSESKKKIAKIAIPVLNHAADALARGDSEPNNANNAATRQE